MENKRYKPLIGKMFFIIWIPTLILLITATVMSAPYIAALLIMLATDIFTVYFVISPLFGYVELREDEVFVKLGFFTTVEIPYNKIRAVVKERKLYADSLISLKNSLDHVNIKYNRFDVLSVSVENNDDLIDMIKTRIFDVQTESF